MPTTALNRRSFLKGSAASSDWLAADRLALELMGIGHLP